jgi:hypothetical protein
METDQVQDILRLVVFKANEDDFYSARYSMLRVEFSICDDDDATNEWEINEGTRTFCN